MADLLTTSIEKYAFLWPWITDWKICGSRLILCLFTENNY